MALPVRWDEPLDPASQAGDDSSGWLVLIVVVTSFIWWSITGPKRRRREEEERAKRVRKAEKARRREKKAQEREWLLEKFQVVEPMEFYGEHHEKERAKYTAVIAEHGGVCMERICIAESRRIPPGSYWHLAHDHIAGKPGSYLGPSHPECNEFERLVRVDDPTFFDRPGLTLTHHRAVELFADTDFIAGPTAYAIWCNLRPDDPVLQGFGDLEETRREVQRDLQRDSSSSDRYSRADPSDDRWDPWGSGSFDNEPPF